MSIGSMNLYVAGCGSFRLSRCGSMLCSLKYIFYIIKLHSATSRKVTGSIPDGVTGIFH